MLKQNVLGWYENFLSRLVQTMTEGSANYSNNERMRRLLFLTCLHSFMHVSDNALSQHISFGSEGGDGDGVVGSRSSFRKHFHNGLCGMTSPQASTKRSTMLRSEVPERRISLQERLHAWSDALSQHGSPSNDANKSRSERRRENPLTGKLYEGAALLMPLTFAVKRK